MVLVCPKLMGVVKCPDFDFQNLATMECYYTGRLTHESCMRTCSRNLLMVKSTQISHLECCQTGTSSGKRKLSQIDKNKKIKDRTFTNCQYTIIWNFMEHHTSKSEKAFEHYGQQSWNHICLLSLPDNRHWLSSFVSIDDTLGCKIC